MTTSHTATFSLASDLHTAYAVLPMRVQINGQNTDSLKTLKIVRQAKAPLHEATFQLLDMPQNGDRRTVAIGSDIRVLWESQVHHHDAQIISWPVFDGQIVDMRRDIDSDSDRLMVTAQDRISNRNDTRIHDAVVVGDTAGTVTISSVCFNPDGQGNRSDRKTLINGRQCYGFQHNPAEAQQWTYAQAITYVILRYFGGHALSPAMEQVLQALTEQRQMRDVSIGGLTPLKALERLCDRAAVSYSLVLVNTSENSCRSRLVFHRIGKGRVIPLGIADAGATLNLSSTQPQQVRIDHPQAAATTRITAMGAPMRAEATWTLVHGWDQGLEDFEDFERYSPLTNTDFLSVQHVFRKWVLNETGTYTNAPFNQTDVPDLAGLFGHKHQTTMPRRFWPCLTCDSTGASLGYYLEVSYDNGLTWGPYDGPFKNLLDECGIYLSCSQFDIALWNALRKGWLQFRMTAAIDDDRNLSVQAADGPVDSWVPVHDETILMTTECRYEFVSDYSMLKYRDDLQQPAPVDDRDRMAQAIRDRLENIHAYSVHGSLTLPYVNPELRCGDRIDHLYGRRELLDKPISQDRSALDRCGQVTSVTFELDEAFKTLIAFGS